MTTITSDINESRKAGVQRIIKHNLKTDMTPMVDLGFLLITFFVITAELSKPGAINLYMPHDGPPMPVGKSSSITFLLGKNDHLFYYYDEEKEAIESNHVFTASYEERSMGNIIAEKQRRLDLKPGGRKNLVVLIKPAKGSSYKNVVDVLDEMTIHEVTGYAVVKPGTEDTKYLEANR